ncbi:pectinesterase family protein [Paraflavitalea sp. CAU 1676]|uniref:pectinesterase family protein n=1 Tax=Paraflavitalea sp. CAU 1676 TaxID=3032598 RepID=UPI0023DA3581|nr:pectinesterase family protein [Paraflavitalea sp. CAU 1676]MDF2189573.1 pectinesterase family protein [Paraflavitalea sp. CAU 1676]
MKKQHAIQSNREYTGDTLTRFGRALVLFVLLISAGLLQPITTAAQSTRPIIVSPDGKGDFKTIQAAVNSLSGQSPTPRLIRIKKGTYAEKVYIEKHNIILEGEGMNATVITASIARDAWRCRHNDDWGVATLNIDGNDITLKNLAVVNSFGYDWHSDTTIACPLDTVNHQRTIGKGSHQMAVRTMSATRFQAIGCLFKAWAGDTMSPWNVEHGLFYFKDCVMEGGVDFYCPRGWAYAENCRFKANTGDAAIWHDGSRVADSKTVLNNCSFEGYDGFKLGRYHRDAQFFLLNCTFAANMADKPIYRVGAGTNIQWGERIYYYNCHRQGTTDFGWYANNLPNDIKPETISAAWVFGDRWKL